MEAMVGSSLSSAGLKESQLSAEDEFPPRRGHVTSSTAVAACGCVQPWPEHLAQTERHFRSLVAAARVSLGAPCQALPSVLCFTLLASTTAL